MARRLPANLIAEYVPAKSAGSLLAHLPSPDGSLPLAADVVTETLYVTKLPDSDNPVTTSRSAAGSLLAAAKTKDQDVRWSDAKDMNVDLRINDADLAEAEEYQVDLQVNLSSGETIVASWRVLAYRTFVS